MSTCFERWYLKIKKRQSNSHVQTCAAHNADVVDNVVIKSAKSDISLMPKAVLILNGWKQMTRPDG